HAQAGKADQSEREGALVIERRARAAPGERGPPAAHGIRRIRSCRNREPRPRGEEQRQPHQNEQRPTFPCSHRKTGAAAQLTPCHENAPFLGKPRLLLSSMVRSRRAASSSGPSYKTAAPAGESRGRFLPHRAGG